jgi:predicted dinucleotide-binding enzyme
MRIGIIGAGNIGGNVARQAVRVGHQVTLSFGRDQEKLRALAADLGGAVGTPAQAVEASEIVVVSVPWPVIPEALAQAGDLAGKVMIDTTNHYGPGPGPAPGQTQAAFNQSRMAGALYTKSFNTLTSAFQAQGAGRNGDQRIVQWVCGDDAEAKATVMRLIEQMGYAAVDFGATADCSVMESPRRAGAVYGEEYRLAEAQQVVDALRSGRPIPPTPSYR